MKVDIYESIENQGRYFVVPSNSATSDLPEKVKLIINTDSHEVSQMENMKYGVWQARRGYAQKSDIINTLPFKDLRLVLEL